MSNKLNLDAFPKLEGRRSVQASQLPRGPIVYVPVEELEASPPK